MTRIAILDLTTHPADRLHGVQRVWERISGWLSPSLPDAALIPFDIAEGGGGLPATGDFDGLIVSCLLYTSPSPRDRTRSRMPSSA